MIKTHLKYNNEKWHDCGFRNRASIGALVVFAENLLKLPEKLTCKRCRKQALKLTEVA